MQAEPVDQEADDEHAGGGMGTALPKLLAGRLDVAFGRTEGLGRPFPAELTRRLVRYEPLALLIPDGHPLAALPEVPCDRLRGVEVDASAGNEDAPEWVDLAVSLLEAFGGRPSAAHPHVIGTSETARHLQSHGLPILTMSERPAVPGAVIRPLVEPVRRYAWAMVHRGDATHPALATLRSVVTELAGKEGWETTPMAHGCRAPRRGGPAARNRARGRVIDRLRSGGRSVVAAP